MSSKAPPLGPVSAYVRDRLARLLDERRVVVWYDAAAAFHELGGRLDLPTCAVVSVAGSGLLARRETETAYRTLEAGDGEPTAYLNLLIYLPRGRGATPEQQQADPFEGFARCGAAFGDHEAEHLAALAQQALPERAAEIVRLFREGRPSLTLLDNLSESARYPLVRQALGSEAPAEALVVAIVHAETADRLAAVPGALVELDRLAQTLIGLPAGPADDYPTWRDRLMRYLLVGELAFDMAERLPAALAAVPYAELTHHDRVLAICERLRETDAGREAYASLALAVERDLRLPTVLAAERPGQRDTFQCQERARLSVVVQAGTDGDLAGARALFAAGARSVWRRDPEREQLWSVVDRCLSFLEIAVELEGQILPHVTRALVEVYTAADGWWRLDRTQRLYEQADVLCGHDDAIQPLLDACRARFRAVAAPLQTAFQAAVRTEGWPPEGVRRQTATFDAHVAPALVERDRTAYFLVDSLRYEMGRDLAQALADVGMASVDGVATVLPTTTPCGMAALMPGADGAFSLIEQKGELVPALGGTVLAGVPERRALLQSRYGDRYHDLTLEDLRRYSQKQLAKQLGGADLVVVRIQDIDVAGEGPSLLKARRDMSLVIGDLHEAAQRLAGLGYGTLVFAADHGHVLVPENLAGDVVGKPPGEWLAQKRRALLGQSQATAPGVLLFSTRDLGIVAPVPEFAAAADFKTFQGGAGYFHEGLSLQECIVPVVVVRAQGTLGATAGGEQVVIRYRMDRFTSAVVGLKVTLSAMFTESLAIRLEAYDGPGPKAGVVGRAGDCDARDPATGEVTLQANVETAVPLVVDADYQGESIEVRASDPRSGVILGRLSLQNARLD